MGSLTFEQQIGLGPDLSAVRRAVRCGLEVVVGDRGTFAAPAVDEHLVTRRVQLGDAAG